jgi:Transcriptional regulator PadR-like family
VLRVYVQAHLDLLLLAVIREEPGGGDAVMRRLRDTSGGRFTPSTQLVYSALHRLERNRLVERSGASTLQAHPIRAPLAGHETQGAGELYKGRSAAAGVAGSGAPPR